jgi:hypothetical protein
MFQLGRARWSGQVVWPGGLAKINTYLKFTEEMDMELVRNGDAATLQL